MLKNYIVILFCTFTSVAGAQSFQLVKDVNPSNNGLMLNCSFTEMNSKLYYVFLDETTQKNSLFVSDGTAAGTQKVSPDNVNVIGSILRGGNKIYFFANDGTNGKEPWVSDGTTAGTTMLANISPTTTDSSIDTIASVFLASDGNKTFFLANDGVKGNELWITDGTPAGTHFVKEIYVGAQGTTITVPQSMGNNMKDGKLYFFALNGSGSATVNGTEPWVSDGTEAGTFMLQDINPGFNGSSETANSKHFIEFNGKMYFYAKSSLFNSGLYQTDGTTTGTQLVYNMSFYRIDEFKIWNDQLYFTHSNGPSLYATNGTAAGTALVATFPNAQLNNLATCQMTTINNTLFLRGVTNDIGSELFKLDGNQIVNVRDLWTGNPSGVNGNVYADKRILQVYDNKIWFLGTDGSQNGAMQVWTSDGTSSGTMAMTPLSDNGWAGGTGNNYNILATSFGVFIIYNSPATGGELYFYSTNPLAIADAGTVEKLMIYPNPAHGKFTIGFENRTYENPEVALYDNSGRCVKSERFTSGENPEILTGDLQSGIYIVKITSGSKQQSKQVIISK